MNELEEYYGKYNEEKRLLRPYGRIEYRTTMKYIHDLIGGREKVRILDVGAGTGRYAVPLAEEGHDVTAVELVRYNLGILKQKAERAGLSEVLQAHQGNALDLSKYPADHYDIVLLLGPLYHLFTKEEKVRVLKEAKRVLVPGGAIVAGYIMNEFGVLTHAFRDGFLKESLENGKLTPDFRIQNDISDLFDFVRLSDIDEYKDEAGLRRVRIFSQDGPTNYMRNLVSGMDEETFEQFYRYHLSTAERPDLLGAGCHTADVLTKD